MKSNLLRLLVISMLFFNYSFSQESEEEEQEEEKEVKIFSEFQFGGNLKIFTGNTFLSDAHEPVYAGFLLEINAIKYANFTLGTIYEYNISEVKKPELAGNFNSIGLNHFAGYIGYNYKVAKFSFIPKIIIGDIKMKQKAVGYYATNNGNFWGFNGQVNYNFTENFAVFLSIGYNFYTFKVQTSPEYSDYFNKSKAINFSVGIKF